MGKFELPRAACLIDPSELQSNAELANSPDFEGMSKEQIEHLAKIEEYTNRIRTDLNAEQVERKAADKANMVYTKKQDRKNLIVAIIGVLIALASLAVAFMK